MINPWKPIIIKPARIHFNIDTDRDTIPDFKDCQPFNPLMQDLTMAKVIRQLESGKDLMKITDEMQLSYEKTKEYLHNKGYRLKHGHLLSPVKLSKGDIENILHRYHSGVPLDTISRSYNVNKNYLKEEIRQRGIEINNLDRKRKRIQIGEIR